VNLPPVDSEYYDTEYETMPRPQLLARQEELLVSSYNATRALVPTGTVDERFVSWLPRLVPAGEFICGLALLLSWAALP
jgi:hypothetical protein